MSTTNHPQLAWAEFLRDAIQRVKRQLQESRKLEDDGSGPPNRVALRKIIDKLPCPVGVVELRFDLARHPHLRNDVCPVMIYDLKNLGRWKVHVHEDVVDAYDHAKVSKVLAEFGVPPADARNLAAEMQHAAMRIGSSDTDTKQVIQFTFGDPRDDPGEFVWHLYTILEMYLRDIRPQVETIDYFALYKMKPLPVLPRQELLAPAPTLQPLTLDELQRRLRHKLLIPPVPEAVQRVFGRARDLYVFGHFRYEFFTVAQHQAVLALEVGVKHRYCQSLGEKVTLRASGGNETVLHRPDYERIWHEWRADKKLTVNGAYFRSSVTALLDWLVEMKIITKWERKTCDYYRGVRDHLSHPTFGSIYPPGDALTAMYDTAQLVNKMFHTVGRTQPLTAKPVKCFVSHAAPDRALAEATADYLKKTIPGFSYFLASVPSHIPADAQWFETIRNELRSAALYLVIVTPTSVSRPWIWFESGAGWMSRRPVCAVIAGGLKKQDVPPPLMFFQISSLEDSEEVSVIVRQLGGQPDDVGTFCAKVQQLALQALETAALQEGWDGVEQNGRYFAWEGPNLHGLRTDPAVPIPEGLVSVLMEKGFIPSYAPKRMLDEQLAHGRKQVFETNRIRWKKEILNTVVTDQVLFVRRGIQ